jgi:hypothetical protein
MIPLTTIVAAIMRRKPRTTENTFDLAFSLASLLVGRTRIRPIHTITPIAITAVRICTLSMISAVISRKSESDSTALRLISDVGRTPISGLQFLNSSRISPLPNSQSAAHTICTKERELERVNIRRRRIFFIIGVY